MIGLFELARVLLAAGLVTGSAGAPADGLFHHPDYSVSVHDGGDLELLLWVSEAALNASGPPKGFPDEWWSAVTRHGAGLRRRASRSSPQTGDCLPLPSPEPTVHGLSEEESVPVTDYVAFAASSELVVVAEILTVEPGAMVSGEGGIGQRVRASVSEILRGDAGLLSTGSEVTFFFHGGFLALGGEVLCGVEEPERAVPDAGATIVLTAWHPEEVQTFINPSTVFPVDRGRVRLPLDGRFWYDEVSLGRLRLSISLVPEAGGEPAASSVQHLLWADPDRRHPLFLPSSMLQATPIDELPMDIVDQQILQSALDGAPRVGTSTRCPDLADITDFEDHRNGLLAPRPQEEVVDREENFRRMGLRPEQIVLEGTVVEVVTGWSPSYFHPASVVVIEIETWLSEPLLALGPGDLVSVLVPEGAVELQGKRLCTRASRFLGMDRPVPEPDETVRVQGRLDLTNTGAIQHIRGGLVPRGGP